MSTALFQAPRLIFLNHSLPVEPSDLESSGSDIAGRSRAFSRKLWMNPSMSVHIWSKNGSSVQLEPHVLAVKAWTHAF